MFRWKKLGNIFCPENNHPWMVSHAANPTPVLLSDDVVKVYFTCRDENNRSHITSVDIDLKESFKVLNIEGKPLLEPGDLGYFDDSGAAVGCYLEHQGQKFIYYLGWNLKVTVPWQNSIGLALASVGSDKFFKYSRAPILDRSNEDPFSISYPSVLIEDGKFRMWYGSNLTWGSNQNQMNHVIKYAESQDGIHWDRTNQICIDLKHPNEYAISRPHVLKINNLYRMWYSFRGNGDLTTYRIGYAESQDGVEWIRKDERAGIDVSESGWDSEMICYPSIFFHRGRYFMLYNGNGYGKTGFGIAVGEKTY
jgi:hypothetical protein